MEENRYKELLEEKTDYKLPRWDDLPDLDLYMDQVIGLMGKYLEQFDFQGEKTLTPSMINNYVKMGVLPCPVKKKYSKVHLSHLLMICIMKQIMPINSIAKLIDILLENKSEEELLDLFADSYENVFDQVFNNIGQLSDELSVSNPDDNLLLALLAVNSAAISSSGKFLSERFINHLPEKEKAVKDKEPKEKNKKI